MKVGHCKQDAVGKDRLEDVCIATKICEKEAKFTTSHTTCTRINPLAYINLKKLISIKLRLRATSVVLNLHCRTNCIHGFFSHNLIGKPKP